MISKSVCSYSIFLFVTIFSIVQFAITIQHLVNVYNKTNHNDEQKISVAYVLGGNPWTRYWFLTNLKSILMNTKKTLDLHIIIDNNTREDVDLMLRTWKLERVNYTIYRLDEFLPQVEWIPTHHYSKKYALSKIILPSIIHHSVEKVIYLDLDIIFRTDIVYLWREFKKMNGTKLLGMAENLSDWYLNKDRKRNVWPAINRGYNAGVMLMNLKYMRMINWNHLWRNETRKNLVLHGATRMADQDIFNAIIYRHPSWVHTIDCGYNYQLGTSSKSQDLCESDPLIIHFNSKSKSVPENMEQFNSVLESVENQNSALLKNVRSSIGSNKRVFSPCGRYLPRTEFHMFSNIFGKPKWENHADKPCLVTQLSVDRIDNFVRGAKKWPYSISASIFGSDEELFKIAPIIKNLNRSDIAIHFVFKPISPSVFPINFLRNLAIKNAQADSLLLIDVDFVVLGDINDIVTKSRNMSNNQAYVLPAFEPVQQVYDFDKAGIPNTKSEMIDALRNNKMRVFRSNIWPHAHRATNLEHWMTSNQSYEVRWEKNYEPYILIKKFELPLYDERFGGFGWNKVTHIMLLKLNNFKFNVLSDTFVLHQSHSPSEDLLRFRNDMKYRRCLQYLKHQFIHEASQQSFSKPSIDLFSDN